MRERGARHEEKSGAPLTPTAHDRIAWFTRVNPCCDIRRIPSRGALPATENAIHRGG